MRFVIAAAALLLAASASAPAAVPESAHTLATHLAGAMKKCWFSGDAAFAAYRYVPEINIGAPRILLVSKKEPNGRPLLVVEPKRAGTADAYGPLLATALAPRIKDDLTRWLKGGSDCG
ncbi:MAG: hypothetical protein WDM94_11785 [Bauldia sp.]